MAIYSKTLKSYTILKNLIKTLLNMPFFPCIARTKPATEREILALS
jgi:hypothetical protein